MKHLTLKATTTPITDEGTFTAVVSAWVEDRQKDVIARAAFDKTIKAWRASGKNLPLLFEHSTEVVGHIYPVMMRATDTGLVASGEIDRDGERGAAAWRMVKSGVAGFSIGFMAESSPRAGGGRTLYEIDLLEVSITSKPVHPATRVVGWKSQGREAKLYEDPATGKGLTYAELRAHAKAKSIRGRPVTVASFNA